MHHRARDLTGLRAGYLTALRYAGARKSKSIWDVECVCGRVIQVEAVEFSRWRKRGVRASCGCKRGESISASRSTHRMSRHKAYAVWRSMCDRCRLPTHQAWKNYGARGIQVCERWQASFQAFWADMGPTYAAGLTLERKDNSLGYTPENCAWATRRRQARNKRTNSLINTPWGRVTVAEAADRSGLNRSTLYYRVNAGVPDSMLFLPPDSSQRFTIF